MRKNYRSKQKGFTLIELVIVIVIIGILSAVAIPKFVDITGNAQQAALDGVASALATASVINSAACNVVGQVVTANKCVKISKCSDLGAAITPALVFGAAGAAIADTYNVAADTAVATNGLEGSCSLQISKNGVTYTKVFIAIGAAN